MNDASNPLVAYGLLGIILVVSWGLFLAGKLVAGREHDRVVAERDALQQKLLDVIPVAKEMGRTAEAMLAYLMARRDG